MKKIFLYITTIIFGASIPIYFPLIWEPLKSEEVISDNYIRATNDKDSNNEDIEKNMNNQKLNNNDNNFNIKEAEDIKTISNSNENIINTSNKIEALSIKRSNIENNLFSELEKSKKLEIDRILKSLSVIDIVKLNDYFSNKEDEDRVKEGLELIKKRMSSSDYEEFKDIINKYIDSDVIK